MASEIDYERILCVKNEVFVFRIPPRSTNRGYRAADWSLDNPDWTGRLKVVAKGNNLMIKLEDKNSGELFAQCPVDAYPGVSVEAVTDSSRYFVIRIKDPNGRNAFIGIGFVDRGDSFDLNVALQDHFKWMKQEKEAEEIVEKFDSGPKLDLGFKEGQTIKLNIGNKKSESSGRTKPKSNLSSGGGGIGLLPPPPGGVKLPAPPGGSPSHNTPVKPVQPSTNQFGDFNSAAVSGQNNSSNVDLLFDVQDSSVPVLEPQSNKQASSDVWGDFASAGSTTDSSATNWVQF